MRWSQCFIPTLREDPADAEVVSHKLLLRAGVVRQLSAGIYSYLPLGQRIALRVMQILREEMNRIGGQEFYLPALHPAEIWQESGRWSAIGDEMFRLKDRKGADILSVLCRTDPDAPPERGISVMIVERPASGLVFERDASVSENRAGAGLRCRGSNHRGG